MQLAGSTVHQPPADSTATSLHRVQANHYLYLPQATPAAVVARTQALASDSSVARHARAREMMASASASEAGSPAPTGSADVKLGREAVIAVLSDRHGGQCESAPCIVCGGHIAS